MSKMGISVLSSYRGGCNFESVGLSRGLVADYFPGMVSRISGIGVSGIENKIKELHKKLIKKMLLYYLLEDYINTEKLVKIISYKEV